jgi:SOS response regulatory protein OraA/RecX
LKRRFPSSAEPASHRPSEAVETALRALRHRDRSAAQVETYLAERGIAADAGGEALETLVRTGLVDDARFAERRGAKLAERGAGNALIRHDLARAGIGRDVIESTIDELESERSRAERVVGRRGPSAKTARYLAAKGFSEETIRDVVARSDDDALG